MHELQERILNEMRPSEDDAHEHEPYSARNLAERLEVPRRTVHNHLQQLVEQGEIHRKENSSRHIVYWIE